MKNEETRVALDDYEKGISLRELQEQKDKQRRHGGPTDDVDSLIVKIAGAPQKGGGASNETR